MTYEIHVREEGRGKPLIRRFTNLLDTQAYIRDRWEGVEYMDGLQMFHTDYCTYECHEFTLKDLGNRASDNPSGHLYWDWVWKDLTGAVNG